MGRPAVNSTKPLSRRVLVEIDRDMTAKTSKVVWQHEVPVIEAIYGEGRVKELDPSTMDEGYTDKVSPQLLTYNKKQERVPRPSEAAGIGFVFVGDARAEYDRLAAAYGRINDKEGAVAVEKVYGRFQEGRFAAMVQGAEVEDLPEWQLRSLIASYGLEPMGGTKDMADDEKSKAAKEREAYVKADRAALLKLAAEAGVQLG
jgi:hypothetical protein